MGRFARVRVANVAYPVTQRGNTRQFLLASDAERLVYLEVSFPSPSFRLPRTIYHSAIFSLDRENRPAYG